MTKIYTPEWARDAVFYQIFPDRFASSERVVKPGNLEDWDSAPTVHGYKGGDLLGVVEKFDYLQDLGVSALYFNPVFQSASNHRYHTHDYYRVDPMLGGNGALRELLDAAHARDMKVVLDGVFNHASRGFFQFNDILENGAKSPYLDWFHIERFPLNAYNEEPTGYKAWWGLDALPKFNTDTQMVREFLWDVATFWLEFGIDGWRLDVPNEIDDDAFWQEFRRRCREVNPECYIIGEIWEDPTRWLQGDQFDAVMNYGFTRAALGFCAQSLNEKEIKNCGYTAIPPLTAADFAEEVDVLLKAQRPEITEVQFNLLGSHDTPRVLTVVEGDESAVRLALLLMFSFPGAPCLYYGDELGLEGANDPYCRQGMPWDDPSGWNTELLEYVKTLVRLRKETPALGRGNFETLHAEEGLFVFARTLHAKTSVIALNTSREDACCELTVGADVAEVEAFQDALGAGLLARDEAGWTLKVPARSGAFFTPEAE